jgi:hypothetical protein
VEKKLNLENMSTETSDGSTSLASGCQCFEMLIGKDIIAYIWSLRPNADAVSIRTKMSVFIGRPSCNGCVEVVGNWSIKFR